MPIISVYNNKGGVGKSTLTVGLAEFLAANRKRSVLVMDMDAQASSSCSLLGREAVTGAVGSKRTIAQLIEVARSGKRPALDSFVTARPASSARGTSLEKMTVLVPDKPGMLDVEERMAPRREKDALAIRDGLKPALARYEFVLIDLPGNIDRRDGLAVAALLISDFVLIPVEPPQISLNSLPDTFDLIHYAHELGKNARPAIIGLVLNKTDKRTEQYRSKFSPILEASGLGQLPPVFDNVIPDTPKLATATDETHDFTTLKDRFDTYYDHVRKVARELEERCERYTFPAHNGSTDAYGSWFRRKFTEWAGKRARAARKGGRPSDLSC